MHKNGIFEIAVGSVQIDLDPLKIDSSYELNKTSVCIVLQIFKLIQLCNDLKYNKSVTVSRFHILEAYTYNGESFRSLRSLSCFRVVQLNSKTLTCIVCQQQCTGKETTPNAPTEITDIW